MWLLILFFLICVAQIAHADVYVVINPAGNVYSISNQNDAVIPSGYKLTVMKGKNIQDLPISGAPQLYNFSNGAFTLNKSALSAQQAQQASAQATEDARTQAKLSAIQKLTDAITKVNPSDVLTNDELQAILPSN